MKRQILYIAGGVPKENYDSYYDCLQTLSYDPYSEKYVSWSKTLWEYLWEEYEVLRTPFHDKDYADYEAWKIMFEKMFPYLRDDLIIVSTSLGSTFILKYLCENNFSFGISQIYFIAPAIHDTPEEKMWSFAFDLEKSAKMIGELEIEKIMIYHSLDDDIVPIQQGRILHTKLEWSIFRECNDKWHFYDQERLLEIEEDIKCT